MRPPAPLVALGLVLAQPLATSAQPFAYPAFPKLTDFSAVTRWIEGQTDIPRGDLLEVRDGFAFALLPGPRAEGARALRLEAVETGAWRALGGRSARLDLDLTCDPPKAIPRVVLVYAGSNRLGPQQAADLTTLPVLAGTLELLAGVLCDPTLRARALVATSQTAVPGAGLSPVSPAPANGHFAAQIGAFASWAGAQRALRAAAARAPDATAGRLTRIDTAESGGRLVYRAMVLDFPGPLAAQAFCGLLGKAPGRCIVRDLR